MAKKPPPLLVTWAKPGPREEKFAGEAVETQKSALRLEETAEEAEGCAECAVQRARSGDVTDLCAEHLKKIYGI